MLFLYVYFNCISNKNPLSRNTNIVIEVYVWFKGVTAMPAVVLSFEYEKLLRSYERIGEAIISYIYDMDLIWEVELARRMYFGENIDRYNMSKTGISYKPFIQWLIFSYRLHAGSSLIKCIYDNYINKLIGYEKDTLSSLINSYEGLYKAYSIEDNNILLKDVLSDKLLYVWDSGLAKNLRKYQGIFMRIVSINNKNIPIPGYSIMTNSVLKTTEQYIRQKYNEYKRFYDGVPVDGFLKINSLMLHKYFLRLSENRI